MVIWLVDAVSILPNPIGGGGAAGDIAEARCKSGDAEGTLAWALALEPPSVGTWAPRGLAAGALAGR